MPSLPVRHLPRRDGRLRLHELRRLTQTVRALARTPPLALEVASELWRAELEAVAAQYAAYGPIGADPGPDPFPGQI